MPQPALECEVCTQCGGKERMACPESMVGILLRHLGNKQHPQLARQKFIMFHPMSGQNTGEITSLMSSFQIGVISTSIALGPHINLLQRETTEHSVSNERKLAPCTFKNKSLFHVPFLTSRGQLKCLLLYSTPTCLNITEEYEGSGEQNQKTRS